jgi:hypothetical protein
LWEEKAERMSFDKWSIHNGGCRKVREKSKKNLTLNSDTLLFKVG